MPRVTFCWNRLTGYAAACFRALAARPGVELRVVAFEAYATAPYDARLLAGFEQTILPAGVGRDDPAVASAALGQRPDVLVISGWAHPPYRRLVDQVRGSPTRLVLAMDTPRRPGWRQRLAPLVVGRYLRRFDAYAVPGARGEALLRYWGVAPGRIHQGLYGVDHAALAGHLEARARGPGGWPRRFLFVGRLEAVKGVPVLLEAYRRYRASVAEPWPLAVLGAGTLAAAVRAEPGVEPAGFVQPDALGPWLERSGAFVLPSLDDPWPLALVEAAAAGLPLVASDACGSADEVVREGQSGLLVPAGSVARLAEALGWCHANAGSLPDLGRRAQALAEPWSAERWADRWSALARQLAGAAP